MLLGRLEDRVVGVFVVELLSFLVTGVWLVPPELVGAIDARRRRIARSATVSVLILFLLLVRCVFVVFGRVSLTLYLRLQAQYSVQNETIAVCQKLKRYGEQAGLPNKPVILLCKEEWKNEG